MERTDIRTVGDLIRAEAEARKRLHDLYNHPEFLDTLARNPDPEFHALVERQRWEARAEWEQLHRALQALQEVAASHPDNRTS